jgi:hypothetical protein
MKLLCHYLIKMNLISKEHSWQIRFKFNTLTLVDIVTRGLTYLTKNKIKISVCLLTINCTLILMHEQQFKTSNPEFLILTTLLWSVLYILLFLSVIELYCLSFSTASHYPFGIFNLFYSFSLCCQFLFVIKWNYYATTS